MDDRIGADHLGSVVSIGVFDGVHRGHQALIARARSEADALGAPLVVMTFDPHPMSVVGPKVAPSSLASIEHRVALLEAAGADAVDVLRFDEALSRMDPQEFVRTVLVDRLHVRSVVVGRDFRFGHGAAGTVDTLTAEGSVHGFGTVPVDLVGDGDDRWSSTRIRSLVESGAVRDAGEALGRPYRVDGTVVHGDHRGRELGYPTANLAWAGSPAVPADGVYAGWLVMDGQELPAAVSVGTNPTFDGRDRRIEAYVIDAEGLDLYGRQVAVAFAERIRGQERFDDVAALVDRMAIDVAECRLVLTA